MKIEQLKSVDIITVVHALQAELEARRLEAADAKILALDTERKTQKYLAIMSETVESNKCNEAVKLELC